MLAAPSGVGDIVCQLISAYRAKRDKDVEPFSVVRTVRMTVHGMVVRPTCPLTVATVGDDLAGCERSVDHECVDVDFANARRSIQRCTTSSWSA